MANNNKIFLNKLNNVHQTKTILNTGEWQTAVRGFRISL